MGRAIPLRLAVLLPALAAACAAGAPPSATAAWGGARTSISKRDAAALRVEQRATAFVRKATKAMRRDDPTCVQKPAPPATFTDAAPSEALLESLLILRRPPIPADSFTRQAFGPSAFAADGIHINWVRLARAVDGRELYVVAAQRRNLPAPLPRACLRLRRTRLVELMSEAPRNVRRKALNINARVNQRDHPAAGFPGGEVVALLERDADGFLRGGAKSGTLEELRAQGIFSAVEQPDYSSKVIGLVPDGVRTIELIYPQRVDRGPHLPPDIYPSEERIVIAVQDNIASVRVPREGPDALPATMIWRTADGSVMRTVRTPSVAPGPGALGPGDGANGGARGAGASR